MTGIEVFMIAHGSVPSPPTLDILFLIVFFSAPGLLFLVLARAQPFKVAFLTPDSFVLRRPSILKDLDQLV